MPIYEYECEKCKKRLEAVQKFSDPLLTECPDCKGKLKKLVSNTSFVLKGSGWYVTDYARKGSSESSSGKGAKKKPGKDASEKKPAEAKAESKAASAPSSPSNTP